jgi:leucyl-tRNA synthetase
LSSRENTANAITGGASAAILDAHSEKIASVAPLPRNDKEVYIGEGVMVNSGKYDGMNSVEFKKKIVEWLENHDKGKRAVNYKLRDWVFSRQRYWGEPIPIVHCEKCGNVALPEKDLPLKLPQVKNYQPTGTGESPLASIKEWVNAKCPKCGGRAKRETNTMPQWAGSNWYFLRYVDPKNGKQLADPEKLKAWLPVDLYVGGAEHAVLHLLYARFIYKFLFDIGVVPKECGDEPFVKLKNQGLILGEDNQKMSKSRGNVVNPDEVIKQYGADTMRMYEMFMGPFEDAKPWNTKGIVGIQRFLGIKEGKGYVDRVFTVIKQVAEDVQAGKLSSKNGFSKSIHSTIKKITEDIENFRFNTCISELMIFFNGKDGKPDWRPKLNKKGEWEAVGEIGKAVDMDALRAFLKLLSPFAPHLAEELWQKLGKKDFICQQTWPKHDEQRIKAKEIEIPIQINGKVRDKILVASDVPEAELKKMVLANVKIKKWLVGKPIKSFRYVRDRIISLAV